MQARLKRVVAQRYTMDCGIAALAMLLSQTYEDTYAAATRLLPRVRKTGIYLKELEQVAVGLGTRLERRPAGRYSVEDDEGLLSVRTPRGVANAKFRWHFVVLWSGLVLDPDGPTVAEAEDYFALTQMHPCTLLVRR